MICPDKETEKITKHIEKIATNQKNQMNPRHI